MTVKHASQFSLYVGYEFMPYAYNSLLGFIPVKVHNISYWTCSEIELIIFSSTFSPSLNQNLRKYDHNFTLMKYLTLLYSAL